MVRRSDAPSRLLGLVGIEVVPEGCFAMRLRQIALAASDLDASVDALTDVLGIEVAYRDPGVGVFGLVNAVMPIGETHLEVVSPVRDDATAKRWIEKRGGDAGYMVILQCEGEEQLGAEVGRARTAGASVVWEGRHEGAHAVHFHPRGLGAILSFDAMPRYDDWVWAGPDWRRHVRTQTVTAITGVEIEGADPEKLAARWGGLLGAAAHCAGGDAPVIALPRGGRLVFVPSDGGEGVVGVELAVADRAGFERRARERGVLGADGAAMLVGTRFVPRS
jgi:catechol 2,3-dioxygenase-like lactoylglutathione lyase family enzyme